MEKGAEIVFEDEESWLGVAEKDVALKKIKFIESVVKRVAEDESDHFDITHSGGGARLFVSLTGKRLIAAIHGIRSKEYPVGYLGNLYVNTLVEIIGEIFHEADVVHEFGDETLVSRSFYTLSSVVALVRSRISSYSFQRRVELSRRSQNKRFKSLLDYERSLFDAHSRLLVLRIDLAYRKGAFIDSDRFYDDLAVVKSHWKRIRYDISSGIPVSGVRGCCAKLEYGILTGFHFHLLVFIDGSRHRSDILLAKMIGEHWVGEVTGGEGRYFNCNRVKERYRKSGIGTINHYDVDSRNNLKYLVMAYLSKPDEHISARAPRERSFFRGNLPKRAALTRGRPRR